MTFSFDGYNYLIRLDTGEHLMAALTQFAKEAQVTGAWISGIGAASSIVLGFHQLSTKSYKLRTVAETMEVVSLNGNLALGDNDATEVHIHGVFADSDYHTVGGHVQELVAGATLELFIYATYKPIRRLHDNTTGLALLNM